MTRPIIIKNGNEDLTCKQVAKKLGLRTQCIRRWYNEYSIQTFKGMKARKALGNTRGGQHRPLVHNTYYGSMTCVEASAHTMELWGKLGYTTVEGIKKRIRKHGEDSIAVFIPKSKNSHHFQVMLKAVGVIDEIVVPQKGVKQSSNSSVVSGFNRWKVCALGNTKCINYNKRVEAIAFGLEIPNRCIKTGTFCKNYEN